LHFETSPSLLKGYQHHNKPVYDQCKPLLRCTTQHKTFTGRYFARQKNHNSGNRLPFNTFRSLADIAAPGLCDQISDQFERKSIGEPAKLVIILKREQIALMIIDQAPHYFRVFVQGEIADLNHKDDARQAIGMKIVRIFLEIFYAVRDAIVGYLGIVKNDGDRALQNIHTKSEIGHHRRIGMLAVDEAELSFVRHLRRPDLARIAVDRRYFIEITGNTSQIFEHPGGRIILIDIIYPPFVRLNGGTLVYRIDPGAFIVHQMGLDAPAKIGTYLEICVVGLQFTHGELACKKGPLVVIGRLALYLFKKLEVKIFEGLFKIIHKLPGVLLTTLKIYQMDA
jgi:hypothetical protein